MQIPPALHRYVATAKAHSPEIMTGAAIVGLTGSCILSARATIKAKEVLSDAKPETKMETFKLVAPIYIPTAVTVASTIALILGANRVSTTRIMAATAMYSLSEKTLTDYKAKVVEKLGESAERSISDEVAQDMIATKPSSQVIVTGGSDVLFYEPLTGRYFQSDMESVRKAQNDINAMLHNELYASLSDFFDLINLPPTRMSEEMGWNADCLVDLSFSTTIADDGRPCIVLDYIHTPKVDYMRHY